MKSVDPSRTCRGCDGSVSKHSRSGLCRSCYVRDPEAEASRIARLRQAFATRPELSEQQRRKLVTLNRTDAARDRARAQAKKLRLWEVGQAKVGQDSRRRGGETLTRRKLAHVPADYLPLYRTLTEQRRYSAADALAAVLEQQPADLARFRRTISGHQA